MYPGLSELVTDIVSGGEGSELYRVHIPDGWAGMDVDEASAMLRAEHRATLLAVNRQGITHTNPVPGFRLADDDDLVVVAESLGDLEPRQEAAAAV